MLVAVVALVSCAGALAACGGALVSVAGAAAVDAACAAVVSAAGGVEVIACDDEDVLGSEDAGATGAESAVEAVSAGSRVLLLRSLRVRAATLLFEREALVLDAVTDSCFSFFADLLALAGSAGGVDFSTGAGVALGSVPACGSAPAEESGVLVSATLGVVEATVLAGVALATMVIEPT